MFISLCNTTTVQSCCWGKISLISGNGNTQNILSTVTEIDMTYVILHAQAQPGFVGIAELKQQLYLAKALAFWLCRGQP